VSNAARHDAARDRDFSARAEHVIGEEECDRVFALDEPLGEWNLEFTAARKDEEKRFTNRKPSGVKAREVPSEWRVGENINRRELTRFRDTEFRDARINEREISIARRVVGGSERKARRKRDERTCGEKRGECCGAS
jgi:hypothetical protein